MRVDKEGWLVAEEGDAVVKRYPTVRTVPLVCPKPLGLVWHWTGGRGGPGFAEGLAQGAQPYKPGVDPAASWHVLLAKDGAVFQSAPFIVGAWHVGVPGTVAGERFANVNRATVGCEIENAGRLRRIGECSYCWPFWINPGAPTHELRPDPRCALEDTRAVAVPGEGVFDAFTQAQVASATALARALVNAFAWNREVMSYGHVDFDPVDREDPGPLWKRALLPSVLNAAFGGSNIAAATPAPKTAHEGGAI